MSAQNRTLTIIGQSRWASNSWRRLFGSMSKIIPLF